MDQAELRIGNQVSFKGLWNGEVEEIKLGVITIKGMVECSHQKYLKE